MKAFLRNHWHDISLMTVCTIGLLISFRVF